MATVRVRVDDAEHGNLPALSAKTGRPCSNPVAIRTRTGRRAVAVVPLEAERVAARRVLTRVMLVLLVVVVAAGVSSFTGAGVVGVVVASAALALYVTLVVVGDLRWVGVRTTSDDSEIELTRVHPAFAHAVDEQYGRSRSD